MVCGEERLREGYHTGVHRNGVMDEEKPEQKKQDGTPGIKLNPV